MANLGSMTITKDTLSWYQLKGPITIFIPVIEIPFTAKSTSDTFYVRASSYFDATPPTAKGGMQWLSLKLTASDGWGSEAQSQWVSMAVAPSYLPYLTRETNTSYSYYQYKWKGTGVAFSGDTVPGNTSRYDTHIWLKDAAGAIRRSTSSLDIGIYAYPKNNDSYTPNNNVLQVGTSHQYSITSPAALSGGGWGNPDSMSDYDRVRTYSALYKDYISAGAWGFDESYGIAELNKKITDNATPVIPNNDPYGDDSDGSGGFGGSGGDGSRENWNDTISTPDLPTLSLSGCGATTIYTPSLSQIKSFFSFLWGDAFSVDGFKKIFSDPMQAIISLHALPCTVAAGASSSVAFGNVDTGITMPKVSSEWMEIDCGSIPFNRYYGSFFDYSPYTKFQIFLPYIGYKDISPDDFVGGSCHVVYHLHIPSGALVCYLLSSTADNSVLYQFSGTCALTIPVSSGSYNQFIGSLITGLASGAEALGNISSTAGKVASGALSAVGSAAAGVASLSNVLGSKPQISRSGSISGAAGWLGVQKPYVIRTRPNAVLTENLNSFQGYPLYRSRMLSQMSGFTVVDTIHLSGISATADEANEIEGLLKSGVIL